MSDPGLNLSPTINLLWKFPALSLQSTPILPSPHRGGYHSSEVLRLGSVSFLDLLFFKIVCTILGPLNLCTNFRISLSIPEKDVKGYLHKNCAQSYISLRSVAVSTTPGLPSVSVRFPLFTAR